MNSLTPASRTLPKREGLKKQRNPAYEEKTNSLSPNPNDREAQPLQLILIEEVAAVNDRHWRDRFPIQFTVLRPFGNQDDCFGILQCLPYLIAEHHAQVPIMAARIGQRDRVVCPNQGSSLDQQFADIDRRRIPQVIGIGLKAKAK